MKTMRSLGVAVGLAVLWTAHAVLAKEAWRPESRWRGFNLLGMFVKGASCSPGHFNEEDFRLISELGFNFVRLPMDYRFWIKDGDWEQIDETKLAAVDEAVAFGKKYGIHVQLCFHRAPGYTVAKPPEPRNLFKDADALRVCCRHWAFFARRYKGVPSRDVSFNLFNEPGKVDEADYARVAAALVAAIRGEDPERFIVADGLEWGGRPAQPLFKLGIGQAMRGYRPMSISHYLASWVGTPSDDPVWPPSQTVSPLYGPMKAPWNVPLAIADLPAGTVKLRLGVVSGKVRLRAAADGRTVWEQMLTPGAGEGWTNAHDKAEWNITQATCLTEYSVPLPQGAKRLEIGIASGDWAALSKLTFTAADGRSAVLTFDQRWGEVNLPVRFAGFDAVPAFRPEQGFRSGTTYLEVESLGPWQPAFDAGVFVMVGEFGAFNRTPHPIVLAWMEDNLKLWQARGLGWALWNFRGSFGVLDSGRNDVVYEDFHGHKLDRAMLSLLQKY